LRNLQNTWSLALATVAALAALACGPGEPPDAPPPVGHPAPQATVPDRNVLVVGLDGADWDIIDPLVADGELPNLARLARQGARARLRTITPVLSPVVWTSMATGKGPNKHGIVDFLARASDGSMVPVTSNLRKVRALWNILGDAGVPVSVTAWWATWPAENVRGFMATDRIAYQLFREVLNSPETADPVEESRGKTWPPSLFNEIEPLITAPDSVGDEDVARFVDAEALGRPDDDDLDRLDELRTIIASTRTYEAIGIELLRRQPHGFHAIYNESTDTVAHLFMSFRPPRRDDVDARRGAAFGAVVDQAYREADAMIGRLLEIVGPDWNVIVASDHGFRHGDNRPSTDSRVDRGPGADWHDRFGVLILWGPDIRAGVHIADASILDVAPTVLALYGLPVADDMDGRVLHEALEPQFLAEHRVETVTTYETVERVAVEVEPSGQDAELMEKLRTLGYIGSNSQDNSVSGQGDAEGLSQDSARAFNNQGVILLSAHDLDGALAEFEKGLAAGGGIQSWTNIAQVHLIRRDLENAEAALGEIERIDGDARALPALRGAAADLRGDDVEAERLLLEAIRINPADSRSHSRLGHILETRGRLGPALAEFEAAIRADPDNAEAHNYAGNVLRRKGDLAGAEGYFRKAVEVDPRYPGAYNNLGLVLQETGRHGEAVELYGRGLVQAPSSPLLHNSLGGLLLIQGDLVGAEREIRAALEAAPEMAEALNNLGILLAEGGRTAEAVDAFERSIVADPDQVDARFNLGKTSLVAGDPERALEQFVTTLELAPGHFQAALGAGETAFRLGRVEDSIRYFEAALGVQPDSPRVLSRLGEMYLERGDRDLAAERWRRSLQIKPAQPELQRRLLELEQ
jgi:tetratricopeptide (TPR) repeat protein/predicted AlkP superfamily phosphohydrolase/phosphomutase